MWKVVRNQRWAWELFQYVFFCFHEPWLGRSAGINSSSVCFPLWWYLKTKGQHFTECGWWLLLQRNGWKQAQDRLATDWATRGSAELQDDPGAAELAMPVNWSQSWCSLISQACAGLSQSQVLWNVDLCVAAAEVRCVVAVPPLLMGATQEGWEHWVVSEVLEQHQLLHCLSSRSELCADGGWDAGWLLELHQRYSSACFCTSFSSLVLHMKHYV